MSILISDNAQKALQIMIMKLINRIQIKIVTVF